MVLRSKDSSFVKEFTEAVNKIKAVLTYTGKEKAELLSKRVVVGQNFENDKTRGNLTAIQTALTNFKLINMEYMSKDKEITTRIIEPFALYNNPCEDWTLLAWCRLSKDFRSFRLDRIHKIVISEEAIEPHKITLEQYVSKFLKNNFPTPDIPLS